MVLSVWYVRSLNIKLTRCCGSVRGSVHRSLMFLRSRLNSIAVHKAVVSLSCVGMSKNVATGNVLL